MIDKSRSVLIKLQTNDNIRDFIKIVTSYENDINIYSESYEYDAKSVMGLMALDVSKPRYVEILSNNQQAIDKFKKDMQPFIVNE